MGSATTGSARSPSATQRGRRGRIGLKTKWTIVTAGGQVWQPYLRANLWEDWGAEANTIYSGTDIVPLCERPRSSSSAAASRPSSTPTSRSSPTPTMSSPSATPMAIGGTAPEAHWARDIRGEPCSGGMPVRDLLQQRAPRRLPRQFGVLYAWCGYWFGGRAAHAMVEARHHHNVGSASLLNGPQASGVATFRSSQHGIYGARF